MGFACCIDDADDANKDGFAYNAYAGADGSRVWFRGKSKVDQAAFNADEGGDGSRVWFCGKRPGVVVWRLGKPYKCTGNDQATASETILSSVISHPSLP
jgi:hypothetical protein